MKKIEISIIMPFYNESGNLLKKSILSVLNQSFKNFEFIIILDNPNNFEGKKIVKEFLKKDKRIVFLENKLNRGLPYSLNKGINLAKGEFIARMDADDTIAYNRLELQYNYMLMNPNCDLLFTGTKYLDENGRLIKTVSPERFKVEKKMKYFFFEQLFVHPTLFARKKVFETEKFDPRYRKAQDFELWLRLMPKFEFVVLNDLLYNYRIKTKSKSKTKYQIKLDNNFAKLKFGISAMHKNYIIYRFNPYFYIKLFKFYIIWIIFTIINFLQNDK